MSNDYIHNYHKKGTKMNKHLKCLLIFVAMLGGTLIISFGTSSLLSWLAEVFSRKTVMVGFSIFALGVIAGMAHVLCNSPPQKGKL